VDFGDARGAIIAVFELLYQVGYPVIFAYVPVVVVRALTVKGTRLHYLVSSLLPVIIIVALFIWPIRLVADALLERPWYYLLADCFTLAVWLWSYYLWKRDRDDDDFWKGLGGRMKRLLRPRRRLQTATGLGR
jgi:uncharacterized membrane protein YagU involved in acid resistance